MVAAAKDAHRIISGVGYSIEHGIYLPEFGVRSEIGSSMSETGLYAASPVQRELMLIRCGELHPGEVSEPA